ncbi:MAG TPA: dephospho-CoA kinase [Cyclobacteriaceae bacterium]|nr:dephospho-CoA kinase [Cyclobacteriaceae bacterium]
MSKPLQVGITGGIGSGKSLICRIFGCLGIPLYDADSRAKNLMTTDRILVDQIRQEFGNLSYDSTGRLNREHLRKAFSDPGEMKKLNKLVHPRVAEDYARWVSEHNEAKYVIKEAALLIESGSAQNLNQLVVVSAPKSLRLQRVLKRDPQRTRQDVENIMMNQMNEEEKMAKADFIIVNDETRLVIPQVLELHGRFNVMN